MPVPRLVDDSQSRLAMQAAVFSCYLLVAIALLYSAWRISATSELIDHILDQQTSILREIKDARASIPSEVKSEIKAAIPEVVKDALK